MQPPRRIWMEHDGVQFEYKPTGRHEVRPSKVWPWVLGLTVTLVFWGFVFWVLWNGGLPT